MKQTLLNILKSTLGVTVLPDSDFLARLNTVYDTMLNNPSCLNPPVDMAGLKATIDAYAAAVSAAVQGGQAAAVERDNRRARLACFLRFLTNALHERDWFVDTTGTSSTRPQRSPSLPLAPLVCRNKSGARYKRPAHIQAELRSIVPLDPSEWIGRIGSFQNETLVCLIRLTHDGNPDVCGILIEELRNRIHYRALKFCDKMDDYDKEQFSSDVDIQVLNLVLTKQPSTEGEILEIAFGRTLQNLARNQLKKFKRSVAGNLVDFSVEYTDVDGADEREGIERLKFLPDPSSSPEDFVLNLDMEKHGHRLLKQALDAVENPRHRKAVILHHGHGIPITSCRRGQDCLTRRFRKDAREIKYWLKIAMQQMRAALGIEV